MAIKLGNRAAQTSDTQGTGTLSLIPPASGSPLQSLAAALGLTSNGQSAQTIYLIEQGAEWEIGIGTVTKGNPDTLSRDQIIESTNSGAAVDWGAGTRNVVLTVDARSILLASGGTVEGDLTVEGDAGIGGRLTASSLQVGGDVSATSFNGGPLGGFRNKIINGDFRVNQRGASAKAQPVGVYGYDRWKGHANGLEQIVEGANIRAGTYTLSWVGGGTGSVNGTSGASPLTVDLPGGANVSVVVPATATDVQLEPGRDATPFEQRPISVEMMLCQRYYEISPRLRVRNPGASSALLFIDWTYKVTKRASPTLGNLGDFSLQATPTPTEGAALAVEVQAGAIGQIPADGPPITADAEL